MRHRNLTILLAILLIATAGSSIFFGVRNSQLQKELHANREYKDQIDSRMSVQKELLSIDSMLVEGEYREALQAYEEQKDHVEINDGQSIEMRVALAKELLRLRYENQIAAIQDEQSQVVDSMQADKAEAIEDVMLTDSLSFALEKAKVQLKCLKKQLKDKSFGEYLTFTNTKGSQMHYVGKVKNGKANGYGVALLSTGSRYEGLWKDNMRHGEGTYYWSDGQYYIGEYRDDQRNGEGTYFWPNGEKYTGHWEDDERDGHGIFYNKDGEIVADGTWDDDKLEDTAKNHKGKSGS